MSRVADNPVKIVDGVTVNIEGQKVKVDGPKGSLSMSVHALVDVKVNMSRSVIVKKKSCSIGRSLQRGLFAAMCSSH